MPTTKMKTRWCLFVNVKSWKFSCVNSKLFQYTKSLLFKEILCYFIKITFSVCCRTKNFPHSLGEMSVSVLSSSISLCLLIFMNVNKRYNPWKSFRHFGETLRWTEQQLHRFCCDVLEIFFTQKLCQKIENVAANLSIKVHHGNLISSIYPLIHC